GIDINDVGIYIDDNNKIMFAYPYMSVMLQNNLKRAIYEKYEYYDINKKNNIREVNNNIKLSWLYNRTPLHEVYYDFIHNIYYGDHYIQYYFILEGVNIKLGFSCGHYYDAIILRTPEENERHISLNYAGIEHLEYIYNFLNLMDIHVHMYECNIEYNDYNYVTQHAGLPNEVIRNIMVNSNIDYDESNSIMAGVKVIAKCDTQYEYEKIKNGNLLVTPLSIEEYKL
ncbi:MAG: hypothetical protein ABFD07_12245, partial [Methanobacterium sp.]